MKLLLSLDGGGTKTRAALINENKEIVFEQIEGVGSFAVDSEKAYLNIDKAIEKCLQEAKKNNDEILFIQMGISGLGAIDDVKSIEKRYFDKYKIKVSVENDCLLALWSVVKKRYEEGMVIVSGTGSAVEAKNKYETVLYGGWGHLIDEYASAYSFVRSVLLYIKEEYEMNLMVSSFGLEILKILNLKDIYKLKVFMYNSSKSIVASFASKILDLENEYKEIINEILQKECSILINTIKRLKKRLNLSSNCVLGFRGGFINKCYKFKQMVKKQILENDIFFIFEDDEEDIIFGSYYMIGGEIFCLQ